VTARARAGALCAFASLLAFAWNTGAAATPLLDYASRQKFHSPPNEALYRRQVLTVTSELARNPAPADCGRTLGAARFADLFDDLGAARGALGDAPGAIEAYERAIACNPRAVRLHAGLAEELLHGGRDADAQAAAQRGLAIDPDDYRLGSILARIDFIDQRWPEAIRWLRSITVSTEDPEQATYWECFLYLAQRRAGAPRPELVERNLTDDWPRPILATLRGEMSEQQLLEVIEDQGSDHRRREMLVEALYYVGEQRFAAGETAMARRYFAATVNLKVLYFIEHHMARAELARMQ
jgi:tetratricopeptide (TPR) repeat protein